MMADRNEVEELLNEAAEEGLDKEASQIMVANLDAVTLAGAQGTEVDLIPTDEVTLAVFLHDGSYSMTENRDAVLVGREILLEALRESKQSESILVAEWIFNTQKQLVHEFIPVTQAGDISNVYKPNGDTALRDTVMAALTGLAAYNQQLLNSGNRTKCVVVVFSDGMDNASRVSALEVRKIAKALLDQEIYVLAYVGFGEKGRLSDQEAQVLADDIGFKEAIGAGKSASEIRRIFRQVSASIIQVSQTSAGAGGFFGP